MQSAAAKRTRPKSCSPWFTKSCDVLPDGQHLLTTSWDRSLRLWDAETGKELPRRGAQALVGEWSLAAFLPGNNQAVVGGFGKLSVIEFIVADAATDKAGPSWSYRVVREFAWPGGRVNSLSVSADRQRLLTNGSDGTDAKVRLWDVNTGQLIRAYDTPAPPKFWWFDVRFLPDGKRFLTVGIPEGGGSPTGLALWDAESGKVLQTFKGHTAPICAVAVMPDGGQAVSGGLDRTVRMWNLPTRQIEPGWVPLFNGKDLTGWKTHPKKPGTWLVDNGVLIGRDGPGCLFSERGDFSDFHVRFEAKRRIAQSKAAVLTRSPFELEPKTNVPRGYEAEIGETIGTLRLNGDIAVPGAIGSPSDIWFSGEIIATKNRIVLKINNEEQAVITDAKNTFGRGHVARNQLTESLADRRPPDITSRYIFGS
jgi:hypothetical protein